MNQWKVISQKSVFKAELFDVNEIVLKNNEEREKIHHIAQRNAVVSVFPLTDKLEIYLVSQYRYMWDKLVLEAVSGYVDKKETIISAAKRELKEEAGITAYQLEEIARVELAGSVFKSKGHLFLAKDLEFGETKMDEDEQISLVKMPLKEAVEKVMTGEINHASSMIGILMLDKLKTQKKL